MDTKFIILLQLIHSLLIESAPISDCDTQHDCILSSIKQISNNPCQFEVCIGFNLENPSCIKSPTDPISHVCVGDGGPKDICQSNEKFCCKNCVKNDDSPPEMCKGDDDDGDDDDDDDDFTITVRSAGGTTSTSADDTNSVDGSNDSKDSKDGTNTENRIVFSDDDDDTCSGIITCQILKPGEELVIGIKDGNNGLFGCGTRSNDDLGSGCPLWQCKDGRNFGNICAGGNTKECEWSIIIPANKCKSDNPTKSPTRDDIPETDDPTSSPTPSPTPSPTQSPTTSPIQAPTTSPFVEGEPTVAPTPLTLNPSKTPTKSPQDTKTPTDTPTHKSPPRTPTGKPTDDSGETDDP
eukprot:140498_1